MAWTGIATDITLEGVVDSRGGGARVGPPPPVVGGPLPETPSPLRRGMRSAGTVLLAAAFLVAGVHWLNRPSAATPPQGAAAAVPLPKSVFPEQNEWQDEPAKKVVATRPSKKARPTPKSHEHSPAAAAPEPADAEAGPGDMSMEKFRQLSGKI